MKKSRVIGMGILLGLIIIAGIVGKINSSKVSKTIFKSSISVKGLIGGEKQGFFNDTDVQKELKNTYGIDLNYNKAGSIDMITSDVSPYDYLFPASENELEMFKAQNKKYVKGQSIFNTPLVFYSWDNVTDALIKQGIVKKVDSSYYIVDMPRMLKLIQGNKKWSDIGLNDFYGKVSIMCTDPTKSNSGNMFAGLLANMLNNGDVVDEKSVEKVLPDLKDIFSKLGYMPSSSGDIFSQYLKTGAGANPIIVGYENQLIEFAQENPEVWKQVKDKVRILYPTPTVWSNHPMIALNDKGVQLIGALQSKKIQEIAWKKHGFRTGITGMSNNTKALNIKGIPVNIDKIIPMPKPGVMQKIIDNLK